MTARKRSRNNDSILPARAGGILTTGISVNKYSNCAGFNEISLYPTPNGHRVQARFGGCPRHGQPTIPLFIFVLTRSDTFHAALRAVVSNPQKLHGREPNFKLKLACPSAAYRLDLGQIREWLITVGQHPNRGDFVRRPC
jgi:hypothetical protein